MPSTRRLDAGWIPGLRQDGSGVGAPRKPPAAFMTASPRLGDQPEVVDAAFAPAGDHHLDAPVLAVVRQHAAHRLVARMTYLEDADATIGGLSFYGSPW